MKPFLKWVGGKQWLTKRVEFCIPEFSGRYIEPFLGGGSVFFHLQPKRAIISDINPRLIETYCAIRDDWEAVWTCLRRHQRNHSKRYYYAERSRKRRATHERAAQFLYLNRTCWNGLYRENKEGFFNVPIGTKNTVIFSDDNFEQISKVLKRITIKCCDFSKTIQLAKKGDFLFVDPPYTTAHNFNGFVKYNQNIFEWKDQLRLRDLLYDASKRGAAIAMTNAHHDDVLALYKDIAEIDAIPRYSVISGESRGRGRTSEALVML